MNYLRALHSRIDTRFPGVSGFGVILLLVLITSQTQLADFINLRLLDQQFEILQKVAPVSTENIPVLIGVDETTSSTLPEPTSLWHHHLAKLLGAVAEAKPAIVGLQLPLPMRSYAFIAPGYDKAMADGFSKLTAAVPVIVGQSVGSTGRVRKVYPDLLAAAGNPPTAITSVCPDGDGVVRRFDFSLCNELAPLLKQPDAKPLAIAMAERLGKQPQTGGLIDYGHGGVVRYLPLIDILHDIDKGQISKLKEAIGGRVVLIGTLLPTEARFSLPVALAGWEPGNHELPTTLVQFQALRSLLGAGMVTPLPGSLLFVALSCLFWFRRNDLLKNLAYVIFIFLVGGVSLYSLHNGVYLPAGMILLTGTFAYASRLVYEMAQSHRDKMLLRSAFAGYVSPQVMREITRSGLKSAETTGNHEAAILFADIRDFSARFEQQSAQHVFTLLNRYFGEAVAAIHSRGGAVDRFIGDGIMASFGVPHALAQPERNALEVAQDMLLRLESLNLALIAEGEKPLQIGIGIHTGTVAAGYIGSRGRNDYTLIGNALSLAVQLEGIGRQLDYPVICSEPVAKMVNFNSGLVDLGMQSLPGHAPLHAYGWRPAVLAHAVES